MKLSKIKAEKGRCPHIILKFYGRNTGAYCVDCLSCWIRKVVSYGGGHVRQSVLEKSPRTRSSCPHGNPPGTARDCACRTGER